MMDIKSLWTLALSDQRKRKSNDCLKLVNDYAGFSSNYLYFPTIDTAIKWILLTEVQRKICFQLSLIGLSLFFGSTLVPIGYTHLGISSCMKKLRY